MELEKIYTLFRFLLHIPCKYKKSTGELLKNKKKEKYSYI